jgi:hypothetical protein
MSQLFDFISIENEETNISSTSYMTGEVYWYIDRTPDYNILDTIHNSIDNNHSKKHDIIILYKNIDFSEEENCYICMEDREKQEFCSLNCEHIVCGICAKNILKSFTVICCPLCRTSVTNITTQIESIKQELLEYCL